MNSIVSSAIGNLPIVPLLLLPFALIFFIIVFPFWGIALAILGLVLLVMRGLTTAGLKALAGPTAAVHRAFRWVLTFGGFVRLGQPGEHASHPPRV
ncbi:MAG TPA: hypothetical protein VH277_06805 [Gemmatimonadaceae bacterium]|jgi:hypothetical protein|nr:hypothetical protein [Gemmatimonadaceae bacterium]